MSHPKQQDFVAEVKRNFPDHFAACRVLEVGSLVINGTVRTLFTGCSYVGIDVVQGPGVDVVSVAHEVPAWPILFDTIISCEALEHDRYWRKTLRWEVNMLRQGGLLVITCAGPKREEHGTARTTPEQSGTSRVEGWENYYHNLTMVDLIVALNVWGEFGPSECRLTREGKDVQFCGVKA